MSRRRLLQHAFRGAAVLAFAGMAASCASDGPTGGGPPGGGGPGGGSQTLDDFVGITTDGTVLGGLYAIRSTGVTTEPVRTAAVAYLASLSAEQRAASLFPIPPASAATDEFRLWSNVDGYQRQGLSLAQLNDQQKALGLGILRAGLSARGLATSETIRKLNTVAGELVSKPDQFNENLYYFTFLGEPSATEPWGWQFEGHHLVLNYFVLGDQVVMTPSFYGTEPRTGGGLSAFDQELAAGIALINSLDAAQQAKAILSTDKTGDNNVAEAFGDNTTVPYQGILATELTPTQQEALFAFVALFVHEDDGHATLRMADIRAQVAQTYFSWVGGTAPDSVFYARVQSPVVLLQFDCQGPGPIGQGTDVEGVSRNHIHAVIRTPNGNDYGKDLLKLHLAGK